MNGVELALSDGAAISEERGLALREARVGGDAL